jgi:hypothetical protein
LIHDRSYTIRFQQDGCVWFSEGPSTGPINERSGDLAVDTVERHTNVAGPAIEPSLTRTASRTQAECCSPRANRLIILGMPADFDRRGIISFGGKQHVIGQFRIP